MQLVVGWHWLVEKAGEEPADLVPRQGNQLVPALITVNVTGTGNLAMTCTCAVLRTTIGNTGPTYSFNARLSVDPRFRST